MKIVIVFILTVGLGIGIIFFRPEIIDFRRLLPQLRHPNNALGAQWFGFEFVFASSEVKQTKKELFFSIGASLCLESIETVAAPVVCPCIYLIFRILKSYRTLSNLVLFRGLIRCVISKGIELLFVSYTID